MTAISNAFSRIRRFVAESVPAWTPLNKQQLVTGSVSFVLHVLVAVLLALWVLPPESGLSIHTILAVPVSKEEAEPVELSEIIQPDSLQEQEFDNSVQRVLDVIKDTTTDLATMDVDRDPQLELQPTKRDMEALVKLGEFGGRAAFGKQAAIQKYGGTAESERAVNAGLRWLRKIQQSDGSWSFGAPGAGARPGRLGSTDMGSTSLAVLCYLGSGHTHKTNGRYRETVTNGLKYLMENARADRTSADLRGNYQGNSGMYVHGLAAICLCEAHAMEPDDQKLTRLARKAIKFIEKTQDKKGGGWRYEPGQPGDTSVVGWQVMAMQSAKTGDIAVSPGSARGAEHFLDEVQTDNGERYKYMPGRRGDATPSMTSVGLLCRMYMGWHRDHTSLQRGVAHLSAIGPDSQNMYYNYYATQVIHHWGGEEWSKWNEVMRKQLVSRQITDGPAAGSWSPLGPHSDSGGQIYQTALSLLTLEVYYRHLPIYRQLESQ
jgi:hypothetical protein